MLAFAAAMWNKAPTMTARMRASGVTPPELEAREMADIVAYLASVRYFAEPGDQQRGRRVIRARGCTSCHKLEGRGGDRAPDLAGVRDLERPTAVIAALWNHVAVGGGVPTDGSWPTLGPGDVADLSWTSLAGTAGPDTVYDVARGDLVDDDALIVALRSGKVAAAGLDVFAGEPRVDRRYFDLANTFLLPHIGSATHETRDAMGYCCLDNLDAYFAGRPCPNALG